MNEAPLDIVAVVDSDSYLKWSAALLGSLPGARAGILLVETPLTVSPAQQAAALEGSRLSPGDVRRVEFRDLARTVGARKPDAVVIAGLGPFVRLMARELEGLDPAPVIVMGLPGISLPAQRGALEYRRAADLFILHSHREIRAFSELAERLSIPVRLGLAHLPYARPVERDEVGGTDLVFAHQAIVPREDAEREQLARILRQAALEDPSRNVVVKLRSRRESGEKETHHEADPLTEVIERLGAVPENLVVSHSSMREALRTAEGLVSVSSTAIIEAIASGVPVVALDTFGVSKANLNIAFIGSGLLGSADDVIHRRFGTPDAAWLADNYFHDESDDTWQTQLHELVELRRQGRLSRRPPLRLRGGRLRRAWDRRRVLGSHDRTLLGAVLFSVAMPVRELIMRAKRTRARATTANSWTETESDITLTTPQHEDPLRRG